MRKLIAGLTFTVALSACARQAEPNNGTASPQSPTQTQGQTPGTINGGGGIGIRCNGKLEMLDLFEARRDNLTLVNVPASEAAAAEILAQRISKHFWNPDTIPMKEQIEELKKEIILPVFEGRPFFNAETGKNENVKYVDSLPLSGDLGQYAVPIGCQLEQVAYFQDRTTELSIVQAKWKELDWLSRAALTAHEVVYMMDRRDGLENLMVGDDKHTSESSRRFVGLLLSEQGVPTRIDGLPLKPQIMICSTDGGEPAMSYAYAFERQGGGVTLEFNVVHGKESFYQMRADFNGGTLADLQNQIAVYDLKANLQLTGSDKPSEIGLHIVKVKTSETPTLALTDLNGELQQSAEEAQTLHCSFKKF